MPVKEIQDNEYDLLPGRYQETEYKEAPLDSPQEIMKQLRFLDEKISRGMGELEALLK